MRKKLFLLDLAVCSIWALVVFGDRNWWSLLAHFLILYTVLTRIIVSFALYRKEKRSWLPLICFFALTALLFSAGKDLAASRTIFLLSEGLGIDFDLFTRRVVGYAFIIWLWVVPLATYIIELCRKQLRSSNLRWADVCGAILWNDRHAKVYCQLMLAVLGALYVGLAMDMRACWLGCMVLSPLSYCLLATYYESNRNLSVSAGVGNSHILNMWLMVVSMIIFFYAQCYAGMWRIGMLIASIIIVAYVCWHTFGRKKLFGVCVLSTLYLGAFLPILTIGNNQYACINYERVGFYTLESYQGIFFVKDSQTGCFGLRDRYGLLVKPEYDNIVYHTPDHIWGTLELRRNGYYTLYDICNNSILKTNDIDQQLQDSICSVLENHCIKYQYAYNEPIEVKVTKVYNSEKLLSHVKMTRNGYTSYYNYEDLPYISEDTVMILSGEFANDTIMCFDTKMQMLHYTYDVKQDSMVMFNIDLKTARQAMPKHEELIELAKRVEYLLNQ